MTPFICPTNVSWSPKSVRSVTILEGLNEDTPAKSPSPAWHYLPDNRTIDRNEQHRLLYVESYGAGSHWRVARLLQRRSKHRIDIVRLARDNWRALALTGHRAISAALDTLAPERFDAIVFSGPADTQRVMSRLPAYWTSIPTIAYFHESQWTYPADGVDRLPHLVSHLETVESCDAIWFNSRYHRDIFRRTALRHRSPSVRALAASILPDHWHKTNVIYPPVQIAARPVRRSEELTISWSARWERDKRPDIMLDVIRELVRMNVKIRLHILGSDRLHWEETVSRNEAVNGTVADKSGFLHRGDYEEAFAGSDVWLSTAEHEYFGVSAIEASLLGAIPVVPNALAYRETLPSAIFYPPGDIEGAARRILEIHRQFRPFHGPWALDAGRFQVGRTTECFDAAVAQVVANR